MALEEDYDHIVGLIYEAALDPAAWGHVFAGIDKAFGLDAWNIVQIDHRSAVPELNLVGGERATGEVARLYNSYYGTIDPRARFLLEMAQGEIFSCHHHFNERFVSASEFYQDFYIPIGLRHLLGTRAYIATDNSYIVGIGLIRGPERGAFQPEHENLLARLTPHFNRALRLAEQSQHLTLKAETALAVRESTALLFLDRTGHLRYGNRYAEALLQAEDILCIRNRAVAPVNGCLKGGNARFAAALAAVVKTRRPVSFLLTGKDPSTRRYSLTLAPTPKETPSTILGLSAEEGVLCLVAPLDRRRVASVQQTMQLFGLSAAEARLARALACGDTPEHYAKENDLRLSTVRSQLSSIFVKTGTEKQAALVRLIAAVPVVREEANKNMPTPSKNTGKAKNA